MFANVTLEPNIANIDLADRAPLLDSRASVSTRSPTIPIS